MADQAQNIERVTVTAKRPASQGLRPDFAIGADGRDRTAIMAARLLSISLSDNSGEEADTLELSFDDSDDTSLLGGAIEAPRTGAWLDISLGYKETGLLAMGRFVVDEVEYSGVPDLLMVRARAIDLRGAAESRLKAQKSRSHRDTTLGALVTKIAGEHGVEAIVAREFAGRPITHLDQTNESDLHFLTRLARREGAIFALKGGKMIFAKRGAPTPASGQAPAPITLTRTQLLSWRLTQATRDAHGSVITKWRNATKAQIQRVTAGSGDPKRTLRHVYESEAGAKRAGEAELERLARATKGALEASVIGDAKLAAGARLNLEGVRKEVDGAWVVTMVEHSMDFATGGFTSRLEAQRP